MMDPMAADLVHALSDETTFVFGEAIDRVGENPNSFPPNLLPTLKLFGYGTYKE